MQSLSLNSKLIALTLFVCWLGACQLNVPTERASIVIFNDTNTVLGYELLLSGKWSSQVNVPAGNFDYAVSYEAQPNEKTPPAMLDQIKVVTPTCSATLQRTDLEKNLKKDPAGRNTWDLHVSSRMLISFGCSK